MVRCLEVVELQAVTPAWLCREVPRRDRESVGRSLSARVVEAGRSRRDQENL